MYRFKVHGWMPNGTNDVEIVDNNGDLVECIEACCFGICIEKHGKVLEGIYNPYIYLELTTIFRYIATSPVDDGYKKIKLLKEYELKNMERLK